jgi:malonate decarboxylase gamma subunit
VSEPHHDIDDLFRSLFGDEYAVTRDGFVLSGKGVVDGQPVAIIGTTDRAYIGARLALVLARQVLDVMRETPKRPILLIVNNSGQRLSLWDELMGNNGYIAHLGKCLDLARRRGHRVIGVVHELAVSAGFMATGMTTSQCYALPNAELRIMTVSAMSRVTRIPEERLTELFHTSPVLGPGVDNFVRIGALHGVLDKNPRGQIVNALVSHEAEDDPRRKLGYERGGRVLAWEIAAMVRQGQET